MSKSAYIRARIEPDLKMNAEAIFNELGVTPTQVITMLYKQVARKHHLPFDLHLPNDVTARAIQSAREGKEVVTCKNAKDLFDQLGM